MNRIKLTLVSLLLLLSVCVTKSDAVVKIVGLTGECNLSYAGCTAIPTVLSIICNGTLAAGNNCPQYWSPDWTDTSNLRAYGYTNQVNPGRCLKSVNGATTWSFCAADPFTTTYVDSTPVAFAVSSTGALLAAVNVNNTTQSCVIKRSTDGGQTWGTVFTQNATYSCGAWNVTAMPSPMKCAKDANVCVLFGVDIASQAQVASWSSTDNGLTWAFRSVSGVVSAGSPPFVGAAVSNDGTVVSTGVTTGQSVTKFVYSRDGTTFVASAVFGTATGAARCVGPFIYNTDPAVMCGANNSTQTWQMVRMNSTVPTVIGAFTLGNGSPVSANGPDVIGIQWSSTVFYLITRLHATGATNVYVTKDNFVSMNFLGTLTPTTTFSSNPRGDIYLWNGAVYWSSGYYTPTGHIMKVGF